MKDGDRLGQDPAKRWVVGGRAVLKQAASTSQMGRFEAAILTAKTKLAALADLPGRWIDAVPREMFRRLLDLIGSLRTPEPMRR